MRKNLLLLIIVGIALALPGDIFAGCQGGICSVRRRLAEKEECGVGVEGYRSKRCGYYQRRRDGVVEGEVTGRRARVANRRDRREARRSGTWRSRADRRTYRDRSGRSGRTGRTGRTYSSKTRTRRTYRPAVVSEELEALDTHVEAMDDELMMNADADVDVEERCEVEEKAE